MKFIDFIYIVIRGMTDSTFHGYISGGAHIYYLFTSLHVILKIAFVTSVSDPYTPTACNVTHTPDK